MWYTGLLLCLLGAAQGFEDKSIAQYLADNSDYSTLSSLISSAGLTSALSGTGPFTILAPTNAAFGKIDQATLSGLAANIAQLTDVLKYHVIQEFVLVPMISQLTQKATLEGQMVNITSGGGSLTINGVSKVNPTNNDIIVNNGVVQPIDTVLMPPAKAQLLNIAQILLQQDDRFKDLFLALLLSGLEGVLETGDYTLFAPVDSAFSAVKDNLLSPTAPNAQAIYQAVLKYHVVPGGRKASQLSNGQSLFTLHGTSLNVTIGSGVLINTANVIDADIMASNGVIHAVDKLLVPGDISQIAGSTGTGTSG